MEVCMNNTTNEKVAENLINVLSNLKEIRNRDDNLERKIYEHNKYLYRWRYDPKFC